MYVKAERTAPLTNRLLNLVPAGDNAALAPLMKPVTYRQGIVLTEPGDEVEHIYFPHSGMISLLAVMKDGKAVETATVGNEGAVGIMAGLGVHRTSTRAVVQVPVVASQIQAAAFRKVVHESAALQDIIVKSNESLLAQVQMTAACNALHPIQARLARWILQTQDRAEDGSVPLTQEMLAEMLGVRRSSVSDVANRMQADGLIRYSRGRITVVDRVSLEATACECYHTVRSQIHQLVGTY